MKNMKQVFNAVLSLAIIVCLFALISSIQKPIYGAMASVVVLSFIGVKIDELMKWTEEKYKRK